MVKYANTITIANLIAGVVIPNAVLAKQHAVFAPANAVAPFGNRLLFFCRGIYFWLLCWFFNSIGLHLLLQPCYLCLHLQPFLFQLVVVPLDPGVLLLQLSNGVQV